MEGRMMKIGVALLLILLLAFPLPIIRTTASSENIVILVSDNSADLAVAISLAISINATVVVSPWGLFNETVVAKIVGEFPDKVIIIGGPVAVPESYVETLEGLGIPVERIGGADRFETNQLVIEWMLSNNIEIKLDKVVLIHGLDFVALEEILGSVINGECMVLLVNDEYENMVNITRLIEEMAPPEVEVINTTLINVTCIQAFLQANITAPAEVIVSHNLSSMKERAIKAIERVKKELERVIELANDLIEVDEEISQDIQTVMALLDEAIENINNDEYEKAYENLLEAMHLLQEIVHKVSLMISTGQIDLNSLLEQKLELYLEMLDEFQSKGADVSEAITIANEVQRLIENKEYDKARELIDQLRETISENMQEIKEVKGFKPPKIPVIYPVIPIPGGMPWKPPKG
ncbi:MAG: hypothetical protein DRN90_02885 [Thermoproteota archaeon]|nr:MAG: hypothetical protein DRN92_04710 [Candidatus Korarchaeota archaeon]RLG48919.1 MAG: hypothetical protein DRN90_02885 [Candidatus Korarchaeota archaeon]